MNRFKRKVKDGYTSNNYRQNEEHNGDATSGSYYVALPDGRLQKVTYSVNGYGGYVADVTYEGEAQYPIVCIHGQNVKSNLSGQQPYGCGRFLVLQILF